MTPVTVMIAYPSHPPETYRRAAAALQAHVDAGRVVGPRLKVQVHLLVGLVMKEIDAAVQEAPSALDGLVEAYIDAADAIWAIGERAGVLPPLESFTPTDAEFDQFLVDHGGVVYRVLQTLLRDDASAGEGRHEEAYFQARESMQDEHAAMLVDLAKQGQEAEFRDLARMVGVRAEDLDGLWAGTRRRLTWATAESPA